VDVDYRVGAGETQVVQAMDSIIFVSWRENMPHPLVQAVNLHGEVIWDRPGIEISGADSIQFGMLGVASHNSAVYAWLDRRDSNGQTSSVFAQRMDVDGRRIWGDEDILVLNRRGIGVTDVTTDLNGGAVFFLGSSYLQQINREGELGVPLSVGSLDQPMIQGLISFFIFPNPANDFASLKFTTPAGREMTLNLYDLQGRLILHDIVHPGGLTHPLDISAFPSGIYFLRLQSGAFGANQTLNIIK
jgi:hypothetical protein